MKDICKIPFLSVQISNDGDVFTCCPAYVNFKKIGNIFEDYLEDIWFSASAKELRKRILNNDYSLCNKELCRSKLPDYISGKINEHNYFTQTPPLPKFITLAYDKECNLQCITCRDEVYKNSKETNEIYNKKINEILVPLMKNAELIALSGAGEAFFSAHSRMLIKKLSKTYPKLKFDINTNGLLFNENNIKALGLNDRINEIYVSLPAINEDVYKKIIRGGVNFNVVLNNIKYMSQLQKNKKIARCNINMVISELNYKEIPDMINFAKELDIFLTISQFYDWGTKFGQEYKKTAVWEINHPKHKDFINVLKQTNEYDKCLMQPLFRELREK